MRILWAVVRLLTATTVLAAIVSQYLVSARYWRSIGVEGIWGKTVDFVAFFTIDSNLMAAALLAVGGVGLLRGHLHPGRGWTTARLAVTAYMLTTGVVYNVLLRGIPTDPASSLPWSSEVLHVAAPLVVLLDWFIAPDRRPIGSGAVGRVVVFPIAWVLVVLLRGPFTGDQVTGSSTYYPYPFLNPANGEHGYLSVAMWVVVIAAFICGVSLLLAWVSRRGSREHPST